MNQETAPSPLAAVAPAAASADNAESAAPELAQNASSESEAEFSHRRIRTFVRRAGRTTIGQAKAYEDIGPQFLLPFEPRPFLSSDWDVAFRAMPTAAQPPKLVLEIGFGMGEATAHIARVLPEVRFLCCEVHEPGVGALLKRIGEQNIHNIRICAHDAVEVIDDMLPLESIDGVHIFFPDPWHKKRHHKRRLIQPPLVEKLVNRLQPGGYIHCATDWEPYAHQILQVLRGTPRLRNASPHTEGWADKPEYRPLTKFENRGLRLGHGVWDLVFTKTP